MSKKINFVTLGCSKNIVDSENVITQLKANNFTVVNDSNNTDAKIVVINTCGFINDAKEESIDTILRFIKAKNKGKIEKVFVMGCLAERYKKDLMNEIPEVDEFFGVNDIQTIVKSLNAEYKKELIGHRLHSTPKHFAYLKVSEGCDRSCSFCAIPAIRGKHISIPIETLVSEAQELKNHGAKEIILIAQDLSYYGFDLNGKFQLAELVERLANIGGLEWIRLHYAYPVWFPLEVLDVMNKYPNVCKYLDIPFQHISDNMLSAMKRGHTKEFTYQLINQIREIVPDISLRTTLLVGHPNETEKDFNELKEFVQQAKFERLGAFTYSHEEDTHSYIHYKDNVKERVKQDRLSEIMEIQQNISLEINENKIGKIFKTIIDRKEGDYYIGRSEFDSPEVDNEILISIPESKIETGNFYQVKITKADSFDLYGTIEE